MVFGVVVRDLSIALAIAMTAFGKEWLTIALLIAMAYVIQIQSAAWYVWLVDRIFGRAPAKTSRAAALAPSDPVEVAPWPDPPPAAEDPMVTELKKILYATDLSETARYAVRYACSIGNRYGAQVTMIHKCACPVWVAKLPKDAAASPATDAVEGPSRRAMANYQH